MCLEKYKLSTCSLNMFVFGIIIFFLSFTGLHDDTDTKIIGKLNIKDTCIILFVIGLLMMILSLLTLCKRKN